jgi:predicted ATPase
MLHHELVGGPLGQSVTVVEPYDSSTRDEKHDTPFHDGETDTYVVPTKGSHELAAKSFSKHNNDNYDNCDAKTVTTATSDLLVTDGASTSGESFSCSSYQERQGPFSELDWSFLRDGELFDRQEQQKKLLDVFYRQMSMGTTITYNTTSDNYNHERDEDHDNKNQRFQSIRSKCSTLNRASLSGRNKEMVIVSGLSGTGKTTLVEETLKRPVVQSGGYFLCGKLDQLNKDKSSPQRPYAPFVMAFSHLVDSVVMNKGVAEEIRACVCSKMTNRDIDLILETFPSLARIIRPQESSNGYDGSTISKNKMNGTMLARVVRIFLESICDPQTRPIVLLIDDLQWADQGTLVLLNSLLSKTEDDRNTGTNGLLLVGTCRHNEVTVDDELALLLRTLEDEENVSICQIEVSNLSRPVSGELFARVLGVPREKYTPEIASSLDPLVDIAYEQTKGNVFFLLQFMRSLHDEGYLRVEAEPQKLAQINITSSSAQQTNNWLWSEKAIRSSSIHDAMSAKKDAVSILARQMKRLPSHEQNTLMVASCLGSKFDKDLLHMAMPAPANEGYTYSPEMLSRSLELLVEKDFVRIDTGSGHYQFCHDKIQQAAIALIKDSKRALFCTNIGRRILERTQSSKNENIFLIVNFFSHGISEGIITDRSERMMVATLALEAGETASSMSDYATSATYLSLGISCLQSNFIGIRNGYWKDEYDFSLTIYNAAAEVEYCTANFERMDALIKEILLNARQFHDKMRAYVTMINSLGTRERLLEAIAQGFSLLECLGEPFHTKDLKIFLLFDLIKTKRMLKNFDSDFERSPQMKDKDKLAAMEILNIIFPYCTMLKHPKAPHAIFRMVQLTVKYGVTATSATGFAGYGMGLCGIGDFLNGNRYGKIALRLLDHFEAKQLTCRVYCIYYGFVSNWNRVREKIGYISPLKFFEIYRRVDANSYYPIVVFFCSLP